MKRTPLLLASTLAILMLTLLASGLSDMLLLPAQPMVLGNGEEVRPVQDSLAEAGKRFDEISIGKQILLIGSFLLAFILAVFFMPAEFRKKLLKLIFKMGLLAFALLYFLDDFKFESEGMVPEEMIPSINISGEEGNLITINPEVFYPQEVAPMWSYFITFLVVAALGALIWWIWRNFIKPKQEEEISLKKISLIAKNSLDNLADGAEWENVIIYSYAEMGKVVSERRGISRESEMTPNEFSTQLIAAGIPENPVLRLTRLFERVRYSTHNAGEDEINEAMVCLDEIASAFGEKL